MNPNASPTSSHAALVAEDDPASRQFLADALVTLGWRVTASADGRAALHEAQAVKFDLLVVDRNLPLVGGLELLPQLRANPQAASTAAPAIATSAEWSPSLVAAASAAGYVATLAKPATLADVRVAISAAGAAAAPVRADDDALKSAGNADNLAALRRLFVVELDRWLEPGTLGSATIAARADALHRLIASAGFCGAPALAAAARALLDALRHGRDLAAPLDHFEAALRAARTAFADV